MRINWDEAYSVTPCPTCGFRRLRRSRYLSVFEHVRAWWTNTAPFRCQSCGWRGRMPDVWIAPRTEAAGKPADVDLDALELPPDAQASLSGVALRSLDIEPGERIRLWLDDQRPAPAGWFPVHTVEIAELLLAAGIVDEASLDHDLGWCEACQQRFQGQPVSTKDQCPHVPSGYDLCLWMAQTGHWPRVPPSVHSGNLEGGARMRGVIMRHWRPPAGARPAGDATGAADRLEHPATVTAELDEMRYAVSTSSISPCPRCGQASLYRLHRRSRWEHLRSWMLGIFPVRCGQCRWEGWMRGPIMVRVTPMASAAPREALSDEIDRLDQ